MSAPTMIDALVAASGNPVVALAVKATLAMLSALLLIRLTRGASAALRHLVAAAAFGALLVLPVAATLVPARPIAVAQAPAAPVVKRAPAERAVPSAIVTQPNVTFGERLHPMNVLYAIYLLGAAAFGVSLLAGIGRLRRVKRDAFVSVAGTRLANETARREGLPTGIEVAVSTELAVPITFGWTRPTILLPAEAAVWDEAELARAIRHELEHIARGDWATHILSRVALVLYWPHPLAWTLWARLRLEAERACDDAVLRSHGQAEPYAEQLVALARSLRGRGAVPALSMATRSTLGQRVESILDESLRRAPRSRATVLTATAAALACVLAIAPVRVVNAAATIVSDVPEIDANDDDDDVDDTLDMALFNAAEEGDLKKMQALMDKGARADAVLRGDGTPLIAAARGGQLEAMKTLIDAGANVNRGVPGDGNALTAAASNGRLDAVRLLLDNGADIDAGIPGDGNALIMASGVGHLDVVRFLVEKGAAIEKVVDGDENPLIHAAEGGQAEVVRYLLTRGANVNARIWVDRGNNGVRGEWRTALSMARRGRHDEVARILLAAGARD